VPGSNLSLGEVQVPVNHLQSRVTEYFLERINITAIQKIVNGEGVPAKMGMQSSDARLLLQSGEEQPSDLEKNIQLEMREAR